MVRRLRFELQTPQSMLYEEQETSLGQGACFRSLFSTENMETGQQRAQQSIISVIFFPSFLVSDVGEVGGAARKIAGGERNKAVSHTDLRQT